MKKVRFFLDYKDKDTRTIHVNDYSKEILNEVYKLVMFASQTNTSRI